MMSSVKINGKSVGTAGYFQMITDHIEIEPKEKNSLLCFPGKTSIILEDFDFTIRAESWSTMTIQIDDLIELPVILETGTDTDVMTPKRLEFVVLPAGIHFDIKSWRKKSI